MLLFCCKKAEQTPEQKTAEKHRSEPHAAVAETKLNRSCYFETYIEYKDSLPLYKKPNGDIAKYFRFEDDPEYDFGGSFLFKSSKMGWLEIGADEVHAELEGFWVQSEFIMIGTTNYTNASITLYASPENTSEITGYIKEESQLNVLNCASDWVYVQKGSNRGWLAPEFICTNSETPCN